MSKKTKKAAEQKVDANHKVIAENRKARHKYAVLETLECGVALVGSEVKSLRNGKLSLDEAYGRVRMANFGWSAATSPNTLRPTA